MKETLSLVFHQGNFSMSLLKSAKRTGYVLVACGLHTLLLQRELKLSGSERHGHPNRITRSADVHARKMDCRKLPVITLSTGLEVFSSSLTS